MRLTYSFIPGLDEVAKSVPEDKQKHFLIWLYHGSDKRFVGVVVVTKP